VDRRPGARTSDGKGNPDRLDTTHFDDINWKGLEFPRESFEVLQEVDRQQWKQEVMGHEELFLLLHDHLPPEMVYERELLICRL
jgi:phosphoenolpyruvate carboxykinase (GTP)